MHNLNSVGKIAALGLKAVVTNYGITCLGKRVGDDDGVVQADETCDIQPACHHLAK